MSQKSGWRIYANLVAVLNQSPVLQVFPYNYITNIGHIEIVLEPGSVTFVSNCTVGLFWGKLSIFLLAITKFLRQTGSKFVLQNSSIA